MEYGKVSSGATTSATPRRFIQREVCNRKGLLSGNHLQQQTHKIGQEAEVVCWAVSLRENKYDVVERDGVRLTEVVSLLAELLAEAAEQCQVRHHGRYAEAGAQCVRKESRFLREEDAAARREAPHLALWEGTPAHDAAQVCRCGVLDAQHKLHDFFALHLQRQEDCLSVLPKQREVRSPEPQVGRLSRARVVAQLRERRRVAQHAHRQRALLLAEFAELLLRNPARTREKLRRPLARKLRGHQRHVLAQLLLCFFLLLHFIFVRVLCTAAASVASKAEACAQQAEQPSSRRRRCRRGVLFLLRGQPKKKAGGRCHSHCPPSEMLPYLPLT
eukprot:TRINITY_DN2903_c0_g1_i7.p1 TRINITY_DN2903_c0_g1~~TRINITY_DN2903_c0_g1_i7.p1  ORF type:complete len:331 (+),score=46.12 TRINITY_DN2903_c0_g1_i7:932-1924(+)